MLRGFLVHSYADRRSGRILLAGRLEDGRSFAAALNDSQKGILVPAAYEKQALSLSGIKVEKVEDSPLKAFDQGNLKQFYFSSLDHRRHAALLFRNAKIPSPDADRRSSDALLLTLGIKGPIEIEGKSRRGRKVDLVFSNPKIGPAAKDFRAPLVLAAIDIETDELTRGIRAISLVSYKAGSQIQSFVGLHASIPSPPDGSLFVYQSEALLLRSFAEKLVQIDPDLITGWNILDFDLPRLAERFSQLNIPFAIGRSSESALYFPGEGRRSASAFVSGRQIFDALRAIRSGPTRYPDYKLETIAHALLGEGKLVSSTDDNKLAELDRLYHTDPKTFALYCLRDSELVFRILEKTGLFKLALERAILTGVSLDKAWTSVASFERIYASKLLERGIASPCSFQGRSVSGAAGGTVLDPICGLFKNVAVFDFRSLYPTIIRTFNIDPYAYERALHEKDPHGIRAPNGALFIRDSGILPALIAEYFAARKEALGREDDNAAYIYKILMNSFYGNLGTPTCRYARSELAGAITSFARKWLEFSRDYFVEKGLHVLYGDTDSLFVQIPLESKVDPLSLAQGINEALRFSIRTEYALESHLELRFEKLYHRFLIPPIRAINTGRSRSSVFSSLAAEESTEYLGKTGIRGRAKGYAGLLLEDDGSRRVEVKGMEAVRSDSTPLARRLQVELLEKVFNDEGEASARNYLLREARRLEKGELDSELIYRKRLVKPPEAYTASSPPQVKVARMLGWKGKRGTIEYVWTKEGAEPAASHRAPLDHRHYLETQVLPFAESLFSAAQWDTATLRALLLGSAEGQLPLF
ncbi:DNA polymerase II [Treponema sp.]